MERVHIIYRGTVPSNEPPTEPDDVVFACSASTPFDPETTPESVIVHEESLASVCYVCGYDGRDFETVH